MLITRGKNAGQTVAPHAYCNDWITVVGSPLVLRPTQVQLQTPEDFAFFASQEPGQRQHGQFWANWRLNEDGTFTRIIR